MVLFEEIAFEETIAILGEISVFDVHEVYKDSVIEFSQEAWVFLVFESLVESEEEVGCHVD